MRSVLAKLEDANDAIGRIREALTTHRKATRPPAAMALDAPDQGNDVEDVPF
jgi:transposase